jgi:hypothetical protein
MDDVKLYNTDGVRSLRPYMTRLASLTPVGVTGVTVFDLHPQIPMPKLKCVHLPLAE